VACVVAPEFDALVLHSLGEEGREEGREGGREGGTERLENVKNLSSTSENGS